MAIRISKVYTKTGDSGETALVGGQRVRKESLRIESYGTVDELNAAVGLARAFNVAHSKKKIADRIESELQLVQQALFNLGSELACKPEDLFPGMPIVSEADIAHLEACMDEWTPAMPILKTFILPGGGMVHAQMHVCRTVCRRAERVVLRLGREEAVRPDAIRYLNRLSDFFFVLGRWVGLKNKEAELLWQTGLQPAGSKADLAKARAKKRL
jgi:cob(I)alamin adenosyltransferase